MQGNTGGSFVFVPMGGGGNDEGKAVAGGLLVVGLVVGTAIYQTMWALDGPDRQALTDHFMADSVAHCANVVDDETVYLGGLKDEFMNIWSSDLQDTRDANPQLVICADDELNGFVMPFDYNDTVKRIWGEHRVMGVLYTQPDGDQALVYKPISDTQPYNTIDDKPDEPTSFATVLANINEVPENAHRYTLPDGTSVSVFIQRDAITQEFGSDRIPDDDGIGWANEELIEEILQHHQFQWPLVRSTGMNYTPGV